MKFIDGITNLVNKLANRRNSLRNNQITSLRLNDSECREIYKTGTFSKVARIKTGYALRAGFEFESGKAERFYTQRIKPIISDVLKYQLGFGRGIILLTERDKMLNEPLSPNPDLTKIKIEYFDGERVTVSSWGTDLLSDRFYKPIEYSVFGHIVHYTRVVDFTYYMPPKEDLPSYKFAGVSESQLIFNELVQDQIIARATASIIEKSSTVFYKLDGFKSNLQNKKEDQVLQYMAAMADSRSLYGDGVLDKEDEIQEVSQQLNGLKDINEASFRRMALVTGIPVTMLIGESVRGLNSSGTVERDSFHDTIDDYRSNYIVPTLSSCFERLGLGRVEAKENSNLTIEQRAAVEKDIATTAQLLEMMGEDHHGYLVNNGIVEDDPWQSQK